MTEHDIKASFSGYAIVEIMGHQRVAGYVTTEYFGTVALFHVQLPAIEAVEQVLDEGIWTGRETLEKGSRIRIGREAVNQYVGAGSLYRLTTCSEAIALAEQPRSIEVLERAERKALVPVGPGFDDEDLERPEDPEDGG